MRKYLLLLLLISCETEEPNYCFNMIRISDALPIQFWLNGQPSFNQKEEDGVDHVCFYQPFNTEDEIKTQFISDVDDDYVLVIVQDDVEIEQLSFTEEGTVPNIVNSLEFVPEDLSITGLVKLLIRKVFDLKNEEFANSSFWANFGTGNDFSIAGGYAGSSILTSPDNVTKVFRQPINLPEGEYTFSVEYIVSDAVFGIPRATPRIHFYNGATLLLTLSGTQTDTEGTHTQSMTTLASPAGVTHVGFSVLGGTGTEYTVAFNYVRMTGVTEEIAHSDLIDIQSLHAKTLLIKYSNPTDYAGLVYEGLEEVPEFGIRVKTKFFEERFPEENESEADGEGNVDKLSSTTKTQRLLEIDPLPPYMHKKLKLALQHNTIYIKNLAWVKEEAYELEKIAEKYPFFKAKSWLTLQSNELILNA